MARVWLRRRGKALIVAWRDRDNRRRQRSFGRDAAARDAFFAKLTLELGLSAPSSAVPSDVTVSAFAAHWIERARGGLRLRTIEAYEAGLERYILPTLGARRIRDLHQQHVAELLAAKLREGYAVATVRHHVYAPLRRMLSRAKFEGIISVNPAERVWAELPIPPDERRAPSRLTREDMGALTAAQLEASRSRPKQRRRR